MRRITFAVLTGLLTLAGPAAAAPVLVGEDADAVGRLALFGDGVL